MLTDIRTVFRKEFKELIVATSDRAGIIRLLIWVVFFGGLFPAQSGRAWLYTLLPVLFWSWMSLFYVSSLAVSAFAGERERHTLETLLATRLPDGAILLGKVLASVAYGWGLVMITYVTAVIAINLVIGQGRFLFYSPAVALGGPLMSLLAALLITGVAVLVSMRAGTQRQAQMALYVVSLVLFLPLLLSQSIPALQAWANDLVLNANTGSFVLVGSLVLLLAAAIALGLARVRFKRSELILD
ncbi:MAG TPA: ABC transporter permease subunit [Aggregatilineales bacterium]|nr:ABC transporter permease subunit [Aggregatilineales bacterium]HQA67914.1 ABC transporter permease subunit [Aggregatilineales bacterium]HQE18253.1 ABC transporter permease subunit [Aggregatilineales bacterium]